MVCQNLSTGIFRSGIIYNENSYGPTSFVCFFVVCRGISHHAETYVRRSALFTASCILAALHPSYVASALVEGNHDICRGLEWIRTWALHITESDTDTECSTVRMAELIMALTYGLSIILGLMKPTSK